MATPNRTLGLLRTGGFFGRLNDAQIARIASISSVELRCSRSVLFREDEDFDSLMLIATGLVALDMHVPLRGAIRILTLGPGEVLAWSAVVGDRRMTASATVLADAELIRIPAQSLDELCATDHEMGHAVMRQLAVALSRRLFATRLQLLDLFADAPSPGIGG